jgi:hypothetical protein
MTINKKLGLMALFAGFAIGKTVAGDLTSYATGDVLICMRNGGANDLVVDAGPISTLTTSASPNQRIPITQYTAGQISAAFTISDGIDWSAFTWLSDNTLYITQARTSLNSQTSPYYETSSSVQHGTDARMATIPPGALAKMGFNGANTATAVIEPDGISAYTSGSSYGNAWLGAYGGYFNGNFSSSVGDAENTAPSGFSTSGSVLRSDFYQLSPTGSLGQIGTFLGYFEMAADGTLTYVAYPSTVPVIKSISRANGVSTIKYTSGLYGTYSLRGTNTLNSGVAPASWPVIATLSDANPSVVQQYLDTDSRSTKFYFITAQ